MKRFKGDLRRYFALFQTSGFWLVNVLWFAAGGVFFQLLPQPAIETSWWNTMLVKALLTVVIVPIYWTLVLDLSENLTHLINRFKK